MIKISNELLNDSAFDLATYIARRFGVRMGNAEERAFITGDGVGKPLGLLAETGGAKVGVKAAKQDAVTFDEIFKLVLRTEGSLPQEGAVPLQRGTGAATDDHQGQQRQLYLEAGSGDRQARYSAEPSSEDLCLHAGDQGRQQGHGLW